MSPKTERRRAKGEARRARRVSRRAMRKGSGATATGLATSLIFPRMVHAALPKPLPHPTWDLLLDHVGANKISDHENRDAGLRDWVHGLVVHPNKPQLALLLTGPETDGKAVFHDAMGLLLPEGGVLRFPTDFPQLRNAGELSRREWWLQQVTGNRIEQLKAAWLIVIDDVPALHLRLFGSPRYRDGRFLKWSLVHDETDRPLVNTIHFDVRPPAIVIPKPDLIRLLEDERDAFQNTIRNYA